MRAIPHPSFRPPVRYHDIALLQLDRQVALSAYVSPACLNVDRELNRTELTATGWGHTQFGGNSSSFLLKVDLEHIDHEKCVEMFGKTSTTLLPRGIVDDFQICAGGVIGKDTCQVRKISSKIFTEYDYRTTIFFHIRATLGDPCKCYSKKGHF